MTKSILEISEESLVDCLYCLHFNTNSKFAICLVVRTGIPKDTFRENNYKVVKECPKNLWIKATKLLEYKRSEE